MIFNFIEAFNIIEFNFKFNNIGDGFTYNFLLINFIFTEIEFKKCLLDSFIKFFF
jgi:hypothetical protein